MAKGMTIKEAEKLTGRSASWLKRNACAWCGRPLLQVARSGCGAMYQRCNPTWKLPLVFADNARDSC